MDIDDQILQLQAHTEGRQGLTYLVTTNDNGSPHVAVIRPYWEMGRLRSHVSDHTQVNIESRPGVSFVWPPDEPDGYTMIVDADAVLLIDDSVSARPIRGVMHRPGEASVADARCTSDCIPLFPA